MAVANELPSLEDEARAASVTSTTQLLEHAVLLLLFAGLVIGVLAVLRPFTTAILFGTILAIAAWPLREFLLRCGLKRGLDAALLLLLALAVVVLPLMAVAPGLAERLTQGVSRLQDYFVSAPQIPSWLAGLPIVGERLARIWDQAMLARAASGPFSNPTPTRCGRRSSGRPGRSPRASCRSSCRWSWRHSSGSAAMPWRRRYATSSGGLPVRPPLPRWTSRRVRCAAWLTGWWERPPSRPS